ncbi:MAG: DUF3067 family protein [Synechococcus sp. SB0665_bin_28]|nr:DUF3067 family protein [Cyanobacteria bacterium MAG IRC3_bin_20]MDE0648344.1 DUF3067 family protein [Cyanobacteria bacterium MAG IRC4_bin_6]MXY63324.1 DUF3067 family protein [Synechococcus sp. SB0665_bin_28]MYF20491.1 DUF3067 family protein [Synechococcus sp. SB0677_bin_5]MYF35779.1 DUF3067 family protein [Synechococcus sp. SB0678_bin_12]MYI87253.1 DUF3067 family protein [Synechococcus sp. SB0672_bin_10]
MAAGSLTVTEVRTLLQQRWGASYDVHLIQRQRRIYLHIMWGYLEQLSFPLDEPTYLARLADVVAAINQLGKGEAVRTWLRTTTDRPRLGKALSLPLQ